MILHLVIPAKTETQSALAYVRDCHWVPAFAGMTKVGWCAKTMDLRNG